MLSINIKYELENENILINQSEDYNKKILELKNQYNNNDIVGILKLNNKSIEIPLVQTKDNDYYLKHSIYKKESNLGATFLDYRININSSKKILIYGHSSINDKIPFNILENYYDKKYYDDNKYIYLSSEKEEKIYEIFSVYIETSDFSYMNINFINDEEFLYHIKRLKNKSMYEIDVDLTKEEEIIILQTCSNNKNYINYEKKYLLIIARRIKSENK